MTNNMENNDIEIIEENNVVIEQNQLKALLLRKKKCDKSHYRCRQILEQMKIDTNITRILSFDDIFTKCNMKCLYKGIYCEIIAYWMFLTSFDNNIYDYVSNIVNNDNKYYYLKIINRITLFYINYDPEKIFNIDYAIHYLYDDINHKFIKLIYTERFTSMLQLQNQEKIACFFKNLFRFNRNLHIYKIKSKYDYYKYVISNKFIDCEGNNINKVINNLLNHNFKFTNTILKEICDDINENNLITILDKEYVFDSECFNKLMKNRKFYDLYKIVTKYGYETTYDNLIKSTKYNKYIKYNGDINEEFINLCAINNCKHYHKKYNFQYSLKSLQMTCEKNYNKYRYEKYGDIEFSKEKYEKIASNINSVEYIVSTGIVPDVKCLEIASRNNNPYVIEYLINECNIKPTNDIINMYIRSCDDKTIKLLLD